MPIAQPQGGAREHRQLARLLAGGDHRQDILATFARRDAQRGEWTYETARRGRRAERGAELHQALVEIAGCGSLWERGHELLRVRPQRALTGRRLDVVLDREHAREHARDVAIDERRALAERDRRDRARGVRPDAGHAAQLARTSRQLAVPVARHGLRTRMQVARARVIAEPGPRREHVVERRPRECADRRKLRHPALPVRDHGRDARLLQHDLADPDRVRIARSPPREIASHGRVVRDDRAADDGRAHATLYQL